MKNNYNSNIEVKTLFIKKSDVDVWNFCVIIIPAHIFLIFMFKKKLCLLLMLYAR